MTNRLIRRHAITLYPESARVILRPFIPSSPTLVSAIIGRTLALTEEEAVAALGDLRKEFASRHIDIDTALLAHYEKVSGQIFTQKELTQTRRLLIGALFSGEYAIESAALFNPSIVAHPDQSGIPSGALRFAMSLRATGEGHISSIEFRTGIVSKEGSVSLDPASEHLAPPEIVPNPGYNKRSFALKFREMGFDNNCSRAVMDPLSDQFTRLELERSVEAVRRGNRTPEDDQEGTLDCVKWLADSNYELRFPANLAMSERIIFPVSSNESNGIEDARFVRFVEDDGEATYYATYTAYNGRAILPQFLETKDFLHFRVITLNGNAVQNKGMALFPRRIDGRFAMLSRQDDENILIMFSDNLHYWNDPQIVMRPAEIWESVKVGNCGSPLETPEGWLVITHGVGPMRKYCIGAMLLDLQDPTKIIGRLREPLLSPEGSEREGYVPNVVYSCGSLLHDGKVILPFAMSDKATTVSSIPLNELLETMRSQI
ncbi:MAG: glycoside hydrolase family 130 protein [Fibrobacterota bacterium]